MDTFILKNIISEFNDYSVVLNVFFPDKILKYVVHSIRFQTFLYGHLKLS